MDTTKNHARAMLLAAGRCRSDRMGARRAASRVRVESHARRRDTGITPFQAMTGREPSILNIGVFGCDAYVHQRRTQRDTTFGPKAEPAIYLGHEATELPAHTA